MLPYGNLRKIDEMIQREANATRPQQPFNLRDFRRAERRKTIAYVVLTLFFISLFTLPYYLVHLRVMKHRIASGELAMEENPLKEAHEFKRALDSMGNLLKLSGLSAVISSNEWREWMRFRFSTSLTSEEVRSELTSDPSVPWPQVASDNALDAKYSPSIFSRAPRDSCVTLEVQKRGLEELNATTLSNGSSTPPDPGVTLTSLLKAALRHTPSGSFASLFRLSCDEVPKDSDTALVCWCTSSNGSSGARFPSRRDQPCHQLCAA